jgi:3-hydroxybutyryl-CoA dehydrogenase
MKNICVIGAGTMGNGIAHIFAQSGYQVHLHDVKEEMLTSAVATIEKNMIRQIKKELISEDDKAKALQRLRTSVDLPESVANADLVIEAATEDFEIKKQLFQQIDNTSPSECVLATNTSSISITQLAAVTQRREQVIGMHFMNPVPVMKLVEIIKGYATREAIVKEVVNISHTLQKIPLVVNDYPGFISNRILMPMINEAVYSLYEGVAGVREIDQVMQLGMAHPMGPLRLADFIGQDVCLSIMRVLQEGFGNPKYAPCPLLVNMVASGNLGVKSGIGFYDYRENPKDPKLASQFTHD